MTVLRMLEFLQTRPELIHDIPELTRQYRLAWQRAKRKSAVEPIVPFICPKCGEFVARYTYKKGYKKIFKQHLEERHAY